MSEDLMAMQNHSEEVKQGDSQDAQNQGQAGTFCKECNAYHQAVDSYSGTCQYDGSDDPNEEEF